MDHQIMVDRICKIVHKAEEDGSKSGTAMIRPSHSSVLPAHYFSKVVTKVLICSTSVVVINS